MVAHWNLKPARLPIPPYPRKKQATELLFSGSWCEKRDLNPYGKTTRPSNVRVYQFRHSRIYITSRLRCRNHIALRRILLYTIFSEMSIPFLKIFLFFSKNNWRIRKKQIRQSFAFYFSGFVRAASVSCLDSASLNSFCSFLEDAITLTCSFT